MSDPVVSVIVPFAQEWPQLAFTLRAVHEELKGIPHEVLAVDNFGPQLLDQMHKVAAKKKITLYIDEGHDRPNDKTYDLPSQEWLRDLLDGTLDPKSYSRSRVAGMTKCAPWLRYVRYADKLSHWNAKNAGVAAARGRLLLFVDAHVVPGRGCLRRMVEAYDLWTGEHGPGSLHAPLTYHVLEETRLIYSLVHRPERGELHYTFAGYPGEWDELDEPQEVPCMSCCGVRLSRAIYDAIGGWPELMGIYGGGENFLNFTMAVLGMKHWVMPGPPLHHYATHRGRGYHYEWGDHKRNQAVAAYLYGSTEKLEAYCRRHPKYERVPEFFEELIETIPALCAGHRMHVYSRQRWTIDEWIEEASWNS